MGCVLWYEDGWEIGVRRIIIEIDLNGVFEEIREGSRVSPVHNALVRDIMEFKARPWEIKIQQVQRKSNRCADWMAKQSHDYDHGFHFLDMPQSDLKSLISLDVYGEVIPQM
ncbi:uncharacterized protein [Arachis hypogaea]|uniref:uncharacterized protein n=1 Tax=Arachis hypogaea TaxID=3818 RepID=UPI003B219E1A